VLSVRVLKRFDKNKMWNDRSMVTVLFDDEQKLFRYLEATTTFPVCTDVYY
jgi:hypothetical protein